MNYLHITRSVSRGRDTYGYNICRLEDGNTNQRYRTCGGGYDMVGTVVGQWLQDNFQDRLQHLMTMGPKGYAELEECGYSVPGWKKRKDLYGLTFDPKGKARLDGGCGLESMLRIAEAIGLNLSRDTNRQGHTRGFFVA